MVYIFTCHLFFLIVFLHFREPIVKAVYQQVAKSQSMEQPHIHYIRHIILSHTLLV